MSARYSSTSLLEPPLPLLPELLSKLLVIDYEPCEKCRAKMALGVTLMEATSKPNSVAKVEMQKGIYPTGRYVVIKREAARKMFDNIGGNDKAFVDTELFNRLVEHG